MANPYDGTEPYATAWQQGHDHGSLAGADTSQAPDFSGWGYDQATTDYVSQAWLEGAAAGAGTTGTADAGLPGGVATPPSGSGGAAPGAIVHTVKFWINAFISPPHVPGPPGYGTLYDYEYFSGDGRGFSSEIHASSRLHSEVEITGVDTGSPAISFQWNMCGESHALDAHLAVVDSKTGHVVGGFGEPTWDGLVVSVHYRGAASMPLISLSPDIDANGTFSVDPVSGAVAFSGHIDSFPWFEAYAAVNNGAALTLMTENPTGSGPESLVGDANRPVHGSAHAPLR